MKLFWFLRKLPLFARVQIESLRKSTTFKTCHVHLVNTLYTNPFYSINFLCQRTTEVQTVGWSGPSWSFMVIFFISGDPAIIFSQSVVKIANISLPTCMLFCRLLIFKINIFEKLFQESNNLDPDQARRFVGFDLGPNCLQRLSADDTSRQRVSLLSSCSISFGHQGSTWLKIFICPNLLLSRP